MTHRPPAKRTFCICGGGNLAHALAAVLGADARNDVRILTRRPSRWRRSVRLHLRSELELVGRPTCVSSDPGEVVPGSRIIIIVVPAFAHADVLCNIRGHLDPEAWVGAIPGQGGFDWMARHYLRGSHRVFGSTRTPYICRTRVYGSRVYVSGVAQELAIGVVPHAAGREIATVLHEALHLPVRLVSNYLVVTLTPANPVVHPARLYSLFRDALDGRVYDRAPRFYRDWDDAASEVLLACDAEIQAMCRNLGINPREAGSVRHHYGINTKQELSARIRGIRPLGRILTPAVRRGYDYRPNLAHRYFTEDVGYCSTIFPAIAELVGVRASAFDMINTWGQQLLGSALPACRDKNNTRLRGLPLPQSFGIATPGHLVQAGLD